MAVPKDAVKLGEWKSGQFSTKWQTVDWDVTPRLTKEGEHEITFLYQSGGHRLHVRKVAVLFGDTVVAHDDHEGRTGNEHVDNTWRLKIPEPPLNTPLKLRAEVRTDGGNNSNGVIFFRPSP